MPDPNQTQDREGIAEGKKYIIRTLIVETAAVCRGFFIKDMSNYLNFGQSILKDNRKLTDFL